MGYTHYWSFHKPKGIKASAIESKYKKAIKDCQKIATAWNNQCYDWERLSGYSAHCKPGTYGGLKINGKGEEAHEEFSLREHFAQNISDFCKTARKGYDTPVAACLLVLKHHLKDAFELTSDGGCDDFESAVEFARKILKKKIYIPESIGPGQAVLNNESIPFDKADEAVLCIIACFVTRKSESKQAYNYWRTFQKECRLKGDIK